MAEPKWPQEPAPEPATPEVQPVILALFDVLGFKAWVHLRTLTAALEAYDELVSLEAVTSSFMVGFDLAEVEPGSGLCAVVLGWPPVHCAHFSDTIILWTPLKRLSINYFLRRCSALVCEALAIGVPLRGAIAVGEGVMHKATSTFVGQPLIEAHELEQAQDWVGVALGPSTTWPKFLEALQPENVASYPPPVKAGTRSELVTGLVLDWPRCWRSRQMPMDAREALAAVSRAERFDKYYRNAMEFVEFSAANSEWYARRAARPT